MYKFVVPSMALQVVDRAIQVFGAEGVSQDTELASLWAGLRTLRIADVCFYSIQCLERLTDLESHVPLGSRCGQ